MGRRDVEIECAELASLLRAGDPPLLLDVRRPDEFEIARLPGAVLVPLHELASRRDEIEAGREVVAYCHHGVRSLNAVMLLRAHGFPGARSLAGGIDAWSAIVDPSVPRY